MLAGLQTLALFMSFQGAVSPKINRIFVVSPYNNSIIFEYAHASILEDQPLTEGAVACFIKELKSTGLFQEIRVSFEFIDNGQRVNINVEPLWNPRIDYFVIDEINFEGFAGLDEYMLREELRHLGVTIGKQLLRYPLPQIKASVQQAAIKIYEFEPQTREEVEERLSELSLRITPTAPERIRLTIAVGQKECRQ